MEYKLAFVGMGTVGQGLLEIIVSKEETLLADYDVSFRIVAVADKLLGSAYNPNGIDPQAILAFINENKSLDKLESEASGWDALETIIKSNADVVIEAAYTDVDTGEPAISHIKAALESGKHVVTTNKGPLLHAYKELSEMAENAGLHIGFEGTVVSGTPVFGLINDCLQGNAISEIKGILNGTTNYILCEMEKGLDYDTALKQAQEAGYAEAVPDVDVLGKDAHAKAIILASVVMGVQLKPSDVPCEGITQVTNSDIDSALQEGFRYKLIASVSRDGNSVNAAVGLKKLPLSDPLAGVSGATNAVTFVSDLLGETTIVGPGAGKIPTGFALLKDLIDIHKLNTRSL